MPARRHCRWRFAMRRAWARVWILRRAVGMRPCRRARYDLIVSNPPYIARDDEHLGQGDLRFEPRGALTDGADGLRDLATIVNGAMDRLRPGGALWMEHGWDQAQAVRLLLANAGFKQVSSLRDLSGIERISGGSL